MLKKPKALVILGCIGVLISFALMASALSKQIDLVNGPTSPHFNRGTLGPIMFRMLFASFVGTLSTIALVAAGVLHFSRKNSELDQLGRGTASRRAEL